MRNRGKTIASLRRLAERPGTPAEGETARRLLEKMEASLPTPKLFKIELFPRGTRIFYNYWCYGNMHGTIVGKAPKTVKGRIWMRIKFDYLKHPRWVPVTRELGGHLSLTALPPDEVNYLWGIQPEWVSDLVGAR